MPNLIPALWEVVRPPCLPIIDREGPFVTLTSEGGVRRWEGSDSRVIFDDVLDEVEVPTKLSLTPPGILNQAHSLIRGHILKHMSRLHSAMDADFDGMFFGYDRAFSCWATREGFAFNIQFCLGYTRREPWFEAHQAATSSMLGCFPSVFDASMMYT